MIEGDQSGISKKNGWKGGGSFVYCGLARLNQNYVDAIETAETEEELSGIYEEIIATGFISYLVDPAEIALDSEDFQVLTLGEKKRFLMELLDKNQLYVNYCDIDDVNFNISENDKKFTKSFYGEVS